MAEEVGLVDDQDRGPAALCGFPGQDGPGRTADLFTDDAVTQIHTAARGKTRTVNNICIAALIATAGAGKNLVDHASARAAIAEITATD